MKIFLLFLFAGSLRLYAQTGNNITLYGTPETDSARKSISTYDTVFVYARYELPEAAIPCNKVSKQMYPDQLHDDYLHEERFDSLSHVVLFDHIVTRKFLNIFLPKMQNKAADLCGVSLTLVNPETSQVVVFYDIFNWVNNRHKQIFNTNREVHNLWGFDTGVITLQTKLKHAATGADYAFGHTEMRIHLNGFE